MTALQIWNTLGRRSKLALTRRDKRDLDDIFKVDGEWAHDRVVVEDVLVRCDKYAAKTRART